MVDEVVNWPTRIDTAASAARVLARAWAQIRAGNLDYSDLSPDEAGQVRDLFGHRGVALYGDDDGVVVGTAKWPPRCAPRLSWFAGSSGLPLLATAGADVIGSAHVTIAKPDDDRFEGATVAGNAPLAAERDFLGVVAPPYAATPSGTHAAALAVLTARDLASHLRDQGERVPLSLGRPMRREADVYDAFAASTEDGIAALTGPWVPLLPRVLPPTPVNGVRSTPTVVPASLRGR